MRSSSSVAGVNVIRKLKEAITFLQWRLSMGTSLKGFDLMFDELDLYRLNYERYTGNSFSAAKTLEIGFGAQPYRLIALMSMGVDVRGIDLDMPILRFSPNSLLRIMKRNGIERALKSGVRNLLFDRRDQARLRKALHQRGYSLNIVPERFLVGDAATYDFGPQTIDIVYSTDVFEHIPPKGLENLLKRLANQVSPSGLLLITPNIFTGITGGHLVEWYMDHFDKAETNVSEPWEHLRRRRYAANTYLNCLSRADYRDLFNRHFDILEEKVFYPDLGREWLTPEVQTELSDWSEDELFSNRVLFTLRPRAAALRQEH